MKVRVQCKPSIAHDEENAIDFVKDIIIDAIENLGQDIPNPFHDISENRIETSLTNSNQDSFQNTPQYIAEVFEGEPSGQKEPINPARKMWWELGRLFIKITAIAACLMLIGTFLYGFHRNSDPDMAPMVKDGDLLLFYRLDKDYSIGDLLLLDFQGERQVRRVVAKAGDTVDITENGLIINGNLKNEPDIFEQTMPYENRVSFPLTVGEGQVFTLGDARENATDSRVYGPVDTEDTLGTVITVMRRRGL